MPFYMLLVPGDEGGMSTLLGPGILEQVQLGFPYLPRLTEVLERGYESLWGSVPFSRS